MVGVGFAVGDGSVVGETVMEGVRLGLGASSCSTTVGEGVGSVWIAVQAARALVNVMRPKTLSRRIIKVHLIIRACFKQVEKSISHIAEMKRTPIINFGGFLTNTV